MNIVELVERVAARSYLTRPEAYRAVEAVFAVIEGAALRGEDIAINRFGKFKVKSVASREGRHPRTGERTHFRASRRLTFHPASALKKQLKGDCGNIGEVLVPPGAEMEHLCCGGGGGGAATGTGLMALARAS